MVRLRNTRRTSSQDYGSGNRQMDIAETKTQSEPPQTFLDFQLVGKMLQLARFTNQLKQNSSIKPPELELEASLLNFAKVFKNHVLTDNRILMMCSTLYQEQNGEVEGQADNLSDVDQESSSSLQMLAQLLNQNSMQDCLSIFVDKIVQNLMSSANSPQAEERRIVDEALDVFNHYLCNTVSCRQIAALPVTKQLAEAHIN